MKCPVCNRDLAPTLSICLTCGAMMNDTVREELQPKINTSGSLPPIEQNATTLPPPRPYVQKSNPYAVPPPATAASAPAMKVPNMVAHAPAISTSKRVETSGLSVSKTSPTLVEFQAKSTSIPEWRLQMQNAVRQRKGTTVEGNDLPQTVAAAPRITHGAKEPRAETVPQQVLENADPRLNNALRRIADSRSSFLPDESTKTAFAPRETPAKNFCFDVIEPRPNAVLRAAPPQSAVNVMPKPTLVAPAKIEKLDTNKLPKLDELQSKTIEKVEEISMINLTIPDAEPTEFHGIKRIFINADNLNNAEPDLIETDEIEDLAPFSMRFNAGLFDLIIGSVVTMALLSPLAFTGGDWFSISGLLIFAAVLSIVMFAYLTACVGFYGKTLGMRIFSLEIVDAEENEYPTIHQAAVHSSIYLATLALGGLGFITVLFNEEKRAIHDLLSGTIIVREF